MNVSNEQVVDEAVVRALRATRANDVETAPTKHSRQTAQCPNIARFAAVFKCGAKWTKPENEHVLGCGFCLDVMKMFVTAAAMTAQEDTVTNMDTSHETKVNIPGATPKAKPAKKPGEKPKPG